MKPEALLEATGLTVTFPTAAGSLVAVDGIDFRVDPGEVLALVGESGSGKSTAALACIGLLGPEARIGGTVHIDGQELIGLAEAERRKLRGRVVSIIFQDPFTSLNPSLPIGRQVAEPLVVNFGISPEAARSRTLEVLAEVGLPDPASLLNAYPHQLSGGMQQRVLIAGALISDPKLLILDEPTTALDVTVEARILDLLDTIRQRRKLGMLFITHNLGVVNRIADRVCVLYAGRVAETGEKDQVLAAPAHPYTKGLLASLPKLAAVGRHTRLLPIPGRLPDMTEPPAGCAFMARCPFAEEACSAPQQLVPAGLGQLARCWKVNQLRDRPWPSLEAPADRRAEARAAGATIVGRDLSKTFTGRQLGGKIRWQRKYGLPWPTLPGRTVHAVNGVSLEIAPSEILGLVGESGSGKSTLGRLLLRLVDLDEGTIEIDGTDVSRLPESKLRAFRSKAQIVFQNPNSSLNPRQRVGEIIGRAAKLHTPTPPNGRRAQVEDLIDRVGLSRSFYDRYPHQLSGGERQRIGIARALATQPSFVVCDEPTSALDVSVQATVLNLLADLREEEGLSYLFISHDLSVVAHISDRIAVMYAGHIVEIGKTADVLHPPYHPYTEALLSAIPLPDPALAQRERVTLRADTPPDGGKATGCPFHPRCPRKLGKLCETVTPPLRKPTPDHEIACHIPLEDLAAIPSVIPDSTPRAEPRYSRR
ncbi:ABC transporter ATP-binding protein [Rhodoligotrophos defluvii]|uniref:dipeptide ABC transporter ATP-binding protein n=1 Tax=Rhodoligotrophos defluvii TaxID=2561934 RepID=UPI0010C9D34F|nr:ABC transporter ATP-binding protein [Rhodoligotrophos defluvii]